MFVGVYLGVYCFHVFRPYVCQSVCLSVTFWFLLHILQNDLGNLFVFYIYCDIDEMSLIEKNKGLRINSFRVILLCYS